MIEYLFGELAGQSTYWPANIFKCIWVYQTPTNMIEYLYNTLTRPVYTKAGKAYLP